MSARAYDDFRKIVVAVSNQWNGFRFSCQRRYHGILGYLASLVRNLSRTLEPIPSHAMPFRLRKNPQKTILDHLFWGENIHRICHFAFFCIPPTTTSFLTNVSDMTSSNKNTRSMPLFHTIFPMGLVQTACDHRVIILAGDQPHVQDSTCGPRHRTPRTANGLLFSELF